MYYVPNETQPDQIIIKAVILGNTEVGKTSLCTRFYLKKWDPLTAPTISATCVRSDIEIDNRIIQFCIWDTAGQERFKSITPLYYRNAHVAIIVVDLTVSQSLDIASQWINELKNNGPADIPFLIFGNKSDLKDRIAVDNKAMEEFASNYESQYFQVSALAGTKVDEAFRRAAAIGLEFYEKSNQLHEEILTAANLTPNENNEKQKSCC